MRHLLTIIIIIAGVALAFVMYSNNRGADAAERRAVDADSAGMVSLSDFSERLQSASETPEAPERDWEHYYGDTLLQYGNTAVCVTSARRPGADDVWLEDQLLVTSVRDGVPVDTCTIADMCGGVFARGETLCVVFGVDTLCYDARRLPEQIRAVDLDTVGKGWRKHKYATTFMLSDTSWDCDYIFNVYLPEKVPAWTKKLIKVVMSHDIGAQCLYDRDDEQIFSEYCGTAPASGHLRGINASKATPRQIAVHYAKEFERLYRAEFDEPDEDGRIMGPKYDHAFCMAPAWTSGDGKYVTYRLYTYCYTMGAHGDMREYYLTFDSKTGRLLGAGDLIKPGRFDSVIAPLEQKINAYKHQDINTDIWFTADVYDDRVEASNNTLLKERVNGKIYPRPAMTARGLVFTYQPYEMGSFGEGVLHFVLPYGEISQSLKLRP